jgi:hypothetical protein
MVTGVKTVHRKGTGPTMAFAHPFIMQLANRCEQIPLDIAATVRGISVGTASARFTVSPARFQDSTKRLPYAAL